MKKIEEIREDMKQAMRNKDIVALNTLRGLMATCTNEIISQGGRPQDAITDEITNAVIKRLVKQRKDAIEQYKSGGRNDLAANEQAELQILENYLPEMMGRDQISQIAKDKKDELGLNDPSKTGILVGMVMKEVQGDADGALVKEVVEELFD
ncbi:MAG: GatB/YqeY domain-containing protein [Patescibacteria group bacterium]